MYNYHLITTQIELPNDFQLGSPVGAKTLSHSVLPNEEERRMFNLLFRNLFTSLQNRRDFSFAFFRREEASVRRARSATHAPCSSYSCLRSPEKHKRKNHAWRLPLYVIAIFIYLLGNVTVPWYINKSFT